MIETLRHIDRVLFHFINHDIANSACDTLCPWLREKLTWIPFYIAAAYLIFRKYGWKKTLMLIVLVAGTILISDQTSGLVKHLVHRLRPCNNPELKDDVRLLIESCGVGYSFVSAHAANHFAIATFISFLVTGNKKIIALLYIWAACVALSQVYVGVHYPADIFAGAIVGIIAGLITGDIARRFVLSRKTKLQISNNE
jgi:undecaprenyl-diphosphatase